MTACCLHNFIIQCREDEEEDQWDEDMEQNDEDEVDVNDDVVSDAFSSSTLEVMHLDVEGIGIPLALKTRKMLLYSTQFMIRRQIQEFNRHAKAAAAANPEGPVTTTSPLDSLFPNLVKHIPLSELKEALTPKYSSDIRYKPTEVKGKGVSTLPTPNRPSTSAATQEPDRIKLFPKEEPEPILPPVFGYNPTTMCFIAMVA
ncbi:hypothetical protein OUZ56_005509 [Daphnia magna]|uniref:Uncharacterized protein n=1 Tax=Daphnia magna TaxID=35525 RepID=A0ABQ9YSZ2_9CRUS|nr:hypothetical protein OUZ56_005509 [Daphnia magna]